MEVWKAALLGLAQGLTEFLPVSSSGHLLLFERILGADTGGADLFLGVMLHAGTLAALLLLYAPRLWRILREDRKTLLFLLAGTLPGLFSGAMITEQMFAIPGIGLKAYEALKAGDIPFIMGYNMFLAILTVLGTLLADLMYAVVDPRVKILK